MHWDNIAKDCVLRFSFLVIFILPVPSNALFSFQACIPDKISQAKQASTTKHTRLMMPTAGMARPNLALPLVQGRQPATAPDGDSPLERRPLLLCRVLDKFLKTRKTQICDGSIPKNPKISRKTSKVCKNFTLLISVIILF
jgi:hypothetical protein